jgi:hypothetical protein
VITLRSQEHNCDLLLSWAGEISIEITGLSGGFLEDGVRHVRVRDDVVGDEEGVDDAEEEKSDGWAN